jgi:hypothetical protein
MGWGVYGTNLAYGAIFSLGLIAFCRAQPRPLLALAVAVPYLVVVVAMGYSRQGVAIGLAFFALLALAERNTVKFVIFVAIAALFHKTAVVLIPIAALASTKRKIWTAVWVGATAVLMYYLYLEESAETLVAGYIEAQYGIRGRGDPGGDECGAGAAVFAQPQALSPRPCELALWTWISLIALVFVPILVPVALLDRGRPGGAVFHPDPDVRVSRLPDALWRGKHRLAVRGGVAIYYGLVMFVWLNYATHSKYWLPYQFYPLVDL